MVMGGRRVGGVDGDVGGVVYDGVVEGFWGGSVGDGNASGGVDGVL